MSLNGAISVLQDFNYMAELLINLWVVFFLWVAFLTFMYFKVVRVLVRYGFCFGPDVNPAGVGEHVAPAWVRVYLPSPTDQPNFGRDMAIVRDKFGIKWRNDFDRLQETGILSETTTPGSEDERRIFAQTNPSASDIPQSAYSGATLLKLPDCPPWSFPSRLDIDKRWPAYHHTYDMTLPPTVRQQLFAPPSSMRNRSSYLIHRINVTGGLRRPPRPPPPPPKLSWAASAWKWATTPNRGLEIQDKMLAKLISLCEYMLDLPNKI
ncbi:uncharacterized protein LOC118437322 [Folsomia candida]|uniref:Uncharacterized protein n=1 Tax=Folsomia candida TaxID=158441 RepID=A0A226DQ04_FOLCA|nr:uncharacterized protein LOC118437322 [Folsomia candida]XP_035712165.1 uncharacterized protein LOC118437322 [Folsomia candida]OXA47592.1 hypothetical protein Fcan01_18021 [Folsomia candida]